MQSRNAGVFAETTNRRAFLDRIVVSVTGVKRTKLGAAIGEVINQPVGGPGRNYARKNQGLLRASGNSCEVVYGQIKLQGVLPTMVMTIRSDGSPVTIEEIADAINAVAEQGWQAKISHVELTFDFRGISIELFRRCAFSPAHRFIPLQDNEGRKTYYIGGRTSPLQVCIYQKRSDVVRLEFKLRRPFLRDYGINGISDLEKLRKLDFRRWLRLMELDSTELRSLEATVRGDDPRDFRLRVLTSWLRELRLQESVRAAKQHFGANPHSLLKWSPAERQMRKMQARMVM